MSFRGIIHFLTIPFAVLIITWIVFSKDNADQKSSELPPLMKETGICWFTTDDVAYYKLFITEGKKVRLLKIIPNKNESESLSAAVFVDINKPALLFLRSYGSNGISEKTFAPISVPPDFDKFSYYQEEDSYFEYPIDEKSGYRLFRPQSSSLIGWRKAIYYETTWYGSMKFTEL